MKRTGIAVLGLLACAPLAANAAGDAPKAVKGVDLAVARGLGNRPNILVAWRNTEKIEELEVLVQNLGDEVGRGQMWMDLVDEDGNVLHTAHRQKIVIPPADSGGREGVLVQTKGFNLLNLMFDELDRLGRRYRMKVHLESETGDVDLSNNVAAKSMNVDQRARSGVNFYRYELRNPSDAAVSGTLAVDQTPLPEGWRVSGNPAVGTQIELGPKQSLKGYLMVEAPANLKEHDFVDFTIGLMGDKGAVIDREEWFLVSSNTPPQLQPPTTTLLPNGVMKVNAIAFDPIGISEASGVQVNYSTDGGSTFTTRVAAYVRGNFYDQTWFESEIGPFRPGEEIQVVVTAVNNAGLISRHQLETIKIPADAQQLSMK